MRVKKVIKVIISSYLSRDIWKMAQSLSLFSFNGSGWGKKERKDSIQPIGFPYGYLVANKSPLKLKYSQ